MNTALVLAAFASLASSYADVEKAFAPESFTTASPSQGASDAPSGDYVSDEAEERQVRKSVSCRRDGATLECDSAELSIAPFVRIDIEKVRPEQRAAWEQAKARLAGACTLLTSPPLHERFERAGATDTFRSVSVVPFGRCSVTTVREWRRQPDGTWRHTVDAHKDDACTADKLGKHLTLNERHSVFAPADVALPLPPGCTRLDTSPVTARALGELLVARKGPKR